MSIDHEKTCYEYEGDDCDELWIEKRWGTDYSGDKYFTLNVMWNDEYEEKYGDLHTQFIKLLTFKDDEAKSQQLKIVKIVMEEMRRHITTNWEFDYKFQLKQSGDNHCLFWLGHKQSKNESYNILEPNHITLKKYIITDFKALKFKTFKRNIKI